MALAQNLENKIRGFFQAYGPTKLKAVLWDKEFDSGRWDCLVSSQGDLVYPYIEEYAKQGYILDLGCGSGSTACELSPAAYEGYTGVDISHVAIEKAQLRTEEAGRGAKTTFAQGDIYSYVPTRQFDVILFRDSIYYIAPAKIQSMLERYSCYLAPNGVLIARMWCITGKYKSIVDIIENSFDIVVKCSLDKKGTGVLVFRARPGVAAERNTTAAGAVVK